MPRSQRPLRLLIRPHWWLAVALATAMAGCAAGPGADRPGPGQRALLEPPAGRVLHGWGQISSWWLQGDPAAAGDPADLDAYAAAVAPHQPALISFYLAPIEGHVTAFLARYREFLRDRPYFIPQIALYFQDESLHHQVLVGDADAQMRRLFEGIKAAGRPVLLRPGYEFNQHGNAYDPGPYPAAFQRVVRLAREVAPGLIATVWHAEPEGFRDRDFHAWDPGDDYVDWWGLSIFFPEYFTDPHVLSFLSEAGRRGKPVLIAECSPWFHGDASAPVRGAASAAEAIGWCDALFKLAAEHPQIKGLSVIVVDWRRLNAKFSQIPGGLPNARLDVWPGLREHYTQAIADRRFIHSEEASWLFSVR